MSDDRKLLEAAARAAGLSVEWDDRTEQTVLVDADGWAGWWNPFTSDADALRLAVKLRMDIRAENRRSVAIPPPDADPERVVWGWSEAGGDSYENMRRAIVRAAAAIGGYRE